MNKPIHIYKAITEAINAWEDRHYINAREHLAPLLGLRGKNAAIQLSNILNYKSYNPRSPKAMKLSQLVIVLEEIDREDVRHILNAFGDPHGLAVVEKEPAVHRLFDLHEAADRAMLENDDVFKVTKMALRDETLDEDELEAIIIEINEAEVANADLKAMAKRRLMEMREGEG